MKRLLLASVFLLWATLAQAQVSSVQWTMTSTTQTSTGLNLVGTGVTSHTFSWNTTGTVSAGACALQSSTEPTFASPSTLIAAQTVTSSGGPTTVTAGSRNYVRISCTTPVVGTGSVVIRYLGFAVGTSGGGGAAGDVNISEIGGNVVGSTIPVSGTVTVTDGAGPLNVIVDSGSLVLGAGSAVIGHVIVDSGALIITGTGTFATQAAQSGTYTVQPGNTPNTTPWLQQIRDAAGNARGANVNASNQLSISLDNYTAISGKLPVAMFTSAGADIVATTDQCDGVAKTPFVFSISTATTTQLLAASASNKWHICSLILKVSAADNVALVEDDTAACASPTAGMSGGVTAATGWVFDVAAGLTFGSGSGDVFQTAATNRYVCFITSTTAQLSGTGMAVAAP